MNNVLIVTGMHRSGTSLVTNWLDRAGLWVGDELIGADRTNPRGHFEDIEISYFQRGILEINGLNHLVTQNDIVYIDPSFYEGAKRLIDKRADKQIWGWKDPRTALLLDFWKELIPSARFLLVFRNPAEVIDSMVRRDSCRVRAERRYRLRRTFETPSYWIHYAEVWQRYNSELINFCRQHPEDTLLFNIQTVLEQSVPILNYMITTWNLPLEVVGINTVYERQLLHKEPGTLMKLSLRLLCSSVWSTYQDLLQLEGRTKKLLAMSRSPETGLELV